jgi:hypothetical protein
MRSIDESPASEATKALAAFDHAIDASPCAATKTGLMGSHLTSIPG